MGWQYWTADQEGSAQIEEWLYDHLNFNYISFYASFINWCHQQVSRSRNPNTKFHGEADKARSQNVWDVLRKLPLDMPAFFGLMDDYGKTQWGAGDKLGYIPDPGKADFEIIAFGQLRLKQIVWTEQERMSLTIEEGGDWALSNHAKRIVERVRARARAAAEESQSALGQYEGMENAASGVQEEVGVDEASAVAAEKESSTPLPWNADLADRTRE